MFDPAPVISVLPIWKFQASEEEPVPASDNTPPAARLAEPLKLYVPGARVIPARSPVSIIAPRRLATWSYAVIALVSGNVTVPAIYSDPEKVPGGKPVIDVPAVPMSPVIMVGPVFVMLA